MPSLHELSFGFLDTLTAHLGLVACLLAVTDERAVWRRLKKLPSLLLSPLTAMLLLIGLYTVPELLNYQYFIRSFAIFFMCTFWVRWVWQFSFWQAFAATCMAGIFQVGVATISAVLLWDEGFQIAVSIGLQLALNIAVAFLLYKLRFGKYFRLLLDNQTASWQTALLLFALETSTELFLRPGRGIQPQYLSFYYLPDGLRGQSERAGDGELGGRFIRVHRAYLAAADKIEAVAWKGNKVHVGGRECLLSRAGKAELRKKLGGEL